MKKIFISTLPILLCTHFASAQKEEKKIDSLSNDVIQSVFIDVSETVDSITKGQPLMHTPYLFYTPESILA